MSGSIGRSYLIQSWNDASSYSGEQIGNRLKESTDLYLANGRANTDLFAEEAPKVKVKKKVPIASRIIPAQHTLNRVDQQERELDKAYENGEVDQEEYEELLHCLQSKRERAHKALCKAIGKPLEDDPVGQQLPDPENVSEGLETQQDSYYLLKSERGIEKNVKADALFFFTGAIICFSLLMWLTN